MKKNRKKSETYRFNGYPHINAGSIHSVNISELQSYIKDFKFKLENRSDPDDKKWVARWLKRFEKELEKKSEGLARKQREKGKLDIQNCSVQTGSSF